MQPGEQAPRMTVWTQADINVLEDSCVNELGVID